jgi:hypothetical protein
MHDARLEELFRALFTFIYRNIKGSPSFDDVARIAEDVLSQMKMGDWSPVWETAARRSILELKRKTSLYAPSRIVAFVTELHEPQLKAIAIVDPETGVAKLDTVEATYARLEDRHGDSIATIDVLGPHLVDRLQRARRDAKPLELLGATVALPAKFDPKSPNPYGSILATDFYFHVVDARESFSFLDLLGATDEEREATARILETLGGLSVVDELRDSVLQELHVAGADDFPLLKQLFEFAVVQALSMGSIGHASGRLHLLLVGPPAQGKKLVGLAARVLNPTWTELSAAKATPAGLIGASHPTGDGWKSRPGALSRAAHGVAVLQDAQGWRPSDITKLGPVLQEVMEDGVVRDSVAGGVLREVPVGLVIDLNRHAHLGTAASPTAPEAAILRLRPFLSRVDLIVEIPADADRAWRVAGKMYEKFGKKPSAHLDRAPWVRELRLVIAALRDKNPVIDLTPVTAAMEEVHDRIRQANQDRMPHTPELGDIPTRLAISFGRFVSAYARGANRSAAPIDDVRRAEVFLSMKLRFLRMSGAWSSASGCPDVPMSRADWVRTHARGPMRPEDLARQYTADTGEAVSEKTIRRDLKQLGAKKASRGLYLLPPAKA